MCALFSLSTTYCSLNVPFTGASYAFYTVSKEVMKMLALQSQSVDGDGIKFQAPMFVFAKCDAEIAEADSMLRYPLFVKHFNG